MKVSPVFIAIHKNNLIAGGGVSSPAKQIKYSENTGRLASTETRPYKFCQDIFMFRYDLIAHIPFLYCLYKLICFRYRRPFYVLLSVLLILLRYTAKDCTCQDKIKKYVKFCLIFLIVSVTIFQSNQSPYNYTNSNFYNKYNANQHFGDCLPLYPNRYLYTQLYCNQTQKSIFFSLMWYNIQKRGVTYG